MKKLKKGQIFMQPYFKNVKNQTYYQKNLMLLLL